MLRIKFVLSLEGSSLSRMIVMESSRWRQALLSVCCDD